MSVAIIPMTQRYGWNSEAKGAIASAFNVGHCITNLVGGYLAATHSPTLILSAGVVVWSIFTAATPIAAATRSLPVLLLTRGIMGLGEGVAFPTMQALVKGWVPSDRRSRSLSLIYSGHQIGSILSLLASPLIIASTSVNAMFMMYGALGFVWLSAWHPLVSSSPPLTGAAASKALPPIKLRDLPWRSFAQSKAFWALVVAHSMFGIGYNLAIAWLPTYYNQEYGLDLQQSSMLSVLPWAVMAFSSNASGWTADALINRKVMSTTRARKLLQSIGTLGPGLCMAYLALIPASGNLREAVTLLTLTLGFQGFQAGGFASNHQDISTRYAPVLFGVTNACASISGSIFVYVVGVLLDQSYSWSLIFMAVAVANFGSAALYLAWGTSEVQFE
ncbi:MAG: hypothetical protein WDW36_002531 [Sanguina aurantia]